MLRPEKIVPVLDTTTASIAKATVNGNQISTNKGIGEWHPFFLTRRLEGRMSFEVEIVSLGKHDILVGIASDALRNSPKCYDNADALTYCLAYRGACLYSEGKYTAVTTVVPQDGWRILVTVDRQAGEVEWTQVHPARQSLHRAAIPAGMRNKTLLPVVHLNCSRNNVVKFV